MVQELTSGISWSSLALRTASMADSCVPGAISERMDRSLVARHAAEKNTKPDQIKEEMMSEKRGGRNWAGLTFHLFIQILHTLVPVLYLLCGHINLLFLKTVCVNKRLVLSLEGFDFGAEG